VYSTKVSEPSPLLIGEGQFIAFASNKNKLVANDTNNKYDVFLKNLKTNKLTLLSKNYLGTSSGNGESHLDLPGNSNNKTILFRSRATNLVKNTDPNGATEGFVCLYIAVAKTIYTGRV
jgi:Tol biopolymer transport system component